MAEKSNAPVFGEADVKEYVAAANSEMQALVDGAKKQEKTHRCYSTLPGYGFVVRNEEKKNVHNNAGELIDKVVTDQGYTMKFEWHRCDVPHQELKAALSKRAKFFSNEWLTGYELAKLIDDPNDGFVAEMYRRSAASGKIRAGNMKNEMSELQFAKILRAELIEFGFLKRMHQPA